MVEHTSLCFSSGNNKVICDARLHISLICVIGQNKRAGHPDIGNIQPFWVVLNYVGVDLALANTTSLSKVVTAFRTPKDKCC